MRIFISLLFIFCTQCSLAQSREDTLKNLSIQWMKALERKDSIALEGFLSEEFTLSTMGESDYVDRATWMRNAIGKDWGNTSYDFKGIKTQGNQAVVNAIMNFSVTPIPFTMQSETLDHWVYSNGRWVVRTRYLGGNSITNFITTAKGLVLGLAFMLIILLFRRYRRRRSALTTGND